MPKTVTVPKRTDRTQPVNFRMMEDDRLEFSFSSERPVDRWWGTEILSHAPECVNLERVAGMQFLWNHCSDSILGKVESILIKDNRGYCQIRWANNSFAQEKKQDVIDGILTNVSFSYQIDEYGSEDDMTYLCTRWTPLEISLVSVPADPTVGIGRSLTLKEKMPTIEETRNDEINRIRTIQGMATAHGFSELANALIESGATIQEAQGRYLEKIKETPQYSVAKPVNPLGLSDKEQNSYSMVRGIQACLSGDWSKAGFERECSLEIAKRSGKQLNGAGFFMPVRDLKVENRATYAVGASATGGYAVQTDLLAENFIDALRNKAKIMMLGAQMLSGLEGNVDIPGQNAVTSTYWVAENAAVTQSEATFLQKQLRPKTLGTLSRYSRLTLLQSSIDIEQFIRRDFAAQIALAIDLAAIAGTGLNNQPTGILNTAGIGSVALGTNGAAPTWNDIINLETEVAIDNADINTCSYLTNARVRGKLKRTEKFATTNGDPIWEVEGMNSMVNGYAAAVSNQVSNSLTKGSGSNLSAILFGDFSQLIIGEWGVLEVLVNPYSDAVYASGGVEIRALQTLDIILRYAQSFAAITDAITT